MAPRNGASTAIGSPLPWPLPVLAAQPELRGAAALSPDGSLLYRGVEDRLVAVDTASMTLAWTRSTGTGIDAAPAVDVDGVVYWASASSLRAYMGDGEPLWSLATGTDFGQRNSPLLGNGGDLYIGGTFAFTGEAVLHEVERFAPFPSSDSRLDMAASGGVLYSDGHYASLVGMPQVTSISINNLEAVEPVAGQNYDYHIREFDRRWGKTEDTFIPLDADRAAYIDLFDPDFVTYSTIIDSRQLYSRFAHFWQLNNPHQPFGSYMAATTCVDSPRDPANLARAGNNHPAPVPDCCELTGGTGDCHQVVGTTPLYDPADGRYFLRYEDPAFIATAMDELRTLLRRDHLGAHLFLDNNRYLLADPEEAEDCYLCVRGCNGDAACEASCRATGCPDARDTTPFEMNSAFPGYAVMADTLIDYTDTLTDTINDEGHRTILNTSAVPCMLGDVIEEERFEDFIDAVGPGNGLAFEQAWHWNCRTSPRLAKQGIDVDRRLLSEGMLVLQYPNYKVPGEQMWMASMAVQTREPGDSLFLSRGPASGQLPWADWSTFYGPKTGSAIDFQANCTTCMTDYRRAGDWYATREFEQPGRAQRITTAALEKTILVDAHKVDGSSLEYGDEQSVNLEGLAALLTGYDLDQYQVILEPMIGEPFDPTNPYAWYRLDNDAFVDAFNEQYETVQFDEGYSYKLYKMEDFFGLGKNCVAVDPGEPTTHCDDLVMVAIQLTVRIDEDTTP